MDVPAEPTDAAVGGRAEGNPQLETLPMRMS
jgi:hypothetical protein